MVGERRAVCSIVFLLTILAGQALPLVSAYATLYEVPYSQDLQPDANGHSYLYVPPRTNELLSFSSFVHDTDMDYTEYSISIESWDRSTGFLQGIGEKTEILLGNIDYLPGWLAPLYWVSSFYEFINTSNTYQLSVNNSISLFGIPIGKTTSVVLSESSFYGIFNVTDQEFFHLTVTSRQDLSMMSIYIMNEWGDLVVYHSISGGDIDVIPFAPVGPGMYLMWIIPFFTSPGLPIIDLKLDAVTPDVLLPGDVINGVLPGSELIVQNEAGDVVHQEKAPTAHTYKLHTPNNSYPGRVQWSLNHPELTDDVYDPFPTRLQVISDTYQGGPPFRYYRPVSNLGDTFYYQSFQSEPYYFTIIGMEETSYNLLQDVPDVPLLPLDTPLFHESPMQEAKQYAYRLALSGDSLIKVNSTNPAAFDWMVFRTFDSYDYRETSLPTASSFHDAQPMFLPAGDYLVVGRANTIDVSAVTTFTVGPVVDTASQVSVYNGDIIGVKYPTEALSFYNFNITLETHDNVSVDCDIDIFDQKGQIISETAPLLGNQQAGLGWVEVGSNRTMNSLGLPPYYEMFCDGYGIVSISPYRVQNNTGPLTVLPDPYMVDYSLTIEDYASKIFNGTETWSQTTPNWTNFTLGDPGDPTEWYMIEASCTPGTWFNVTYLTEDVDAILDIVVYQRYSDCTFRLDLTDLTDTQTGTVSHGAFEFGAISDDVLILFLIDRDMSFEGSLDVIITPYEMNTYTYPPLPPYIGPDALGSGVDLGQIALGAGVVGLLVVVVVVVFLAKKRGKI